MVSWNLNSAAATSTSLERAHLFFWMLYYSLLSQRLNLLMVPQATISGNPTHHHPTSFQTFSVHESFFSPYIFKCSPFHLTTLIHFWHLNCSLPFELFNMSKAILYCLWKITRAHYVPKLTFVKLTNVAEMSSNSKWYNYFYVMFL